VSFCRNIAKGKVGDSKGKGREKVKNFVKKYKWRIFVLTKYLRMYYNREDKVFTYQINFYYRRIFNNILWNPYPYLSLS
jgi:hypothetical protein